MSSPFRYEPPMEPHLTVLHRDADILVLDKQSGLLCVAGKPAEHGDCLERRARDAYPDARIVHRLDRDTSGVIVMAMNPKAHRHLGLQFERRKIRKTYVARVWGDVVGESGRVDLPIACDWPNRPKQMVDMEAGRPAQTEWEILAREETTTRLRLSPLTGRSHQLRVHMLSLGHPILGDNFYATGEAFAAADRLQLHAETLTLHHPADGTVRTYSVPCPF
ncbi:pseudouridine synthase [Parvibaculum sp.]|uniref:pseudouridine synthase n=1 Tax=Parvibaculum sp. TaxID=2024848 RepID=UPI0027306852|nr:pseudouridine synthase [Parvibaculum sp.]MDP1628883.1 pseudouridine synthase [Parvibaculum sp.]MDP2148278.1 pseudouridine synthase [Parvibaculum sp.]MDP3330035.1 pseudouridine synthase [Parvibaculum sp.]